MCAVYLPMKLILAVAQTPTEINSLTKAFSVIIMEISNMGIRAESVG